MKKEIKLAGTVFAFATTATSAFAQAGGHAPGHASQASQPDKATSPRGGDTWFVAVGGGAVGGAVAGIIVAIVVMSQIKRALSAPGRMAAH